MGLGEEWYPFEDHDTLSDSEEVFGGDGDDLDDFMLRSSSPELDALLRESVLRPSEELLSFQSDLPLVKESVALETLLLLLRGDVIS